jgi:uncharacterized protein (TIGR02594 family)
VKERKKVSDYNWLSNLSLPKTILEGVKLLGTVETPGPRSNKIILDWAKEVGVSKSYSDDSIPWCGLFAAVVVKRAGKDVVENPLWARNWSNFGTVSSTPGLGDVLVFVRNGGGHVGFYVAEDSTAYHVLGGNQSDAVTITRIVKTRCIGARRPFYTNKPDSVKPYVVRSTGKLSENEQ